MMTKYFVALVCTAVSTVALADTTAVYKSRSKTFDMSMTLEIADSGDVRYQMSTGRTYGLVLKGVDYFVTLEAKGPVVDRMDDLVTAQKEAMAAFMPGFKEHDASSGPELIPIGNVTINGRTGRGYGYKKGASPAFAVSMNPEPNKVTTREATQSDIKSAMAAPVVVISDDPELAPVGKVMTNQLSKSFAMLSGMIGGTPGFLQELQAILKTGTPLSVAGMELQSVNHAPIDSARFALPGPPETLDQIRQRMKPLPPPPTASPSKP